MRNTIRWRIGLPFVLLLVLTMVGVSTYFISLFRQTYLDNLKADLLANARLVGKVMEPLLADPARSAEIDPAAKLYANLLGVRREGVTQAAHDLQRTPGITMMPGIWANAENVLIIQQS